MLLPVPVFAGLAATFFKKGNIMARKWMVTLQVLTCFGVMIQLTGCLFVERDHRGHWGHRGAHYSSERVVVQPELNIKIR